MADIEVEQKGEVAWIRLNRPDRMNAYDGAMAKELIAAIEGASESGVIVLTGAGRAFCAGGYLANLSKADLSRANLSRANLSNADVEKASLVGADLSGTKLSGATWWNGFLCREDAIGRCR